MSGNDGQGQKKAEDSSRIPDINHAAISLSHGSIAAASNSSTATDLSLVLWPAGWLVQSALL